MTEQARCLAGETMSPEQAVTKVGSLIAAELDAFDKARQACSIRAVDQDDDVLLEIGDRLVLALADLDRRSYHRAWEYATDRLAACKRAYGSMSKAGKAGLEGERCLGEIKEYILITEGLEIKVTAGSRITRKIK